MPTIKILEKIYHNHNRKGLLETIDKILDLAPERLDLKERKISIEISALLNDDSKEDTFVEEERDGRYTLIKEFKLISQACSNKLKRSDKELSKLRCRLTSNSAFSKLAPFKVEEANLDPYIVVYHDVISDDEIEVFKKYSKSSLVRAQVLNLDSSTRVRYNL